MSMQGPTDLGLQVGQLRADEHAKDALSAHRRRRPEGTLVGALTRVYHVGRTDAPSRQLPSNHERRIIRRCYYWALTYVACSTGGAGLALRYALWTAKLPGGPALVPNSQSISNPTASSIQRTASLPGTHHHVSSPQ